jgi:hypothetical protein
VGTARTRIYSNGDNCPSRSCSGFPPTYTLEIGAVCGLDEQGPGGTWWNVATRVSTAMRMAKPGAAKHPVPGQGHAKTDQRPPGGGAIPDAVLRR